VAARALQQGELLRDVPPYGLEVNLTVLKRSVRAPMRPILNRTDTTLPWLVAGVILPLMISLTILRICWEQTNIVTTTGVYEGGKYAGFINNYFYMDQSGNTYYQAFPILMGPQNREFKVQFYKSDPGKGWIKSGLPSAALVALVTLDVFGVALLLGLLWPAIQKGGTRAFLVGTNGARAQAVAPVEPPGQALAVRRKSPPSAAKWRWTRPRWTDPCQGLWQRRI
jgi:hypothetical protein